MTADDGDQHAADYVLGTLRGAERAAFATALAGDSDLRRRVAAWEGRLFGLAAAVAPVEPPPRLWDRIEAGLGSPARVTPFRRRLVRFGAPVAVLAAAAVILLALMMRPAVVPPTLVAVLGATAAAQPAFAVQAAPGQPALITPVGSRVPPAGHAYELWLVRGSAPPLALGVIGPGGRFEVAPDGLPGGRLEGGETLAVSLEIPGGAPDGVPGGPILFTGTLVPLAPAGGR